MAAARPSSWSSCALLLSAIALLLSSCVNAVEITGSYSLAPNTQLNGYVFTIGTLPTNQYPVDVRVPQPTITGGGLTLQGWSDNSVRGEYAFSFEVVTATITDSSIIITGAVPADGTVTISTVQATSTAQQPIFDFTEMLLTNNLTVVLRNMVTSMTGAAANEPVVKVGGSTMAPQVTYYSVLSIIGLSSTGSSAVLEMQSPSSASSIMVSDHALVSIASTTACGLGQAVVQLDSSIIVADSSVFRILSTTVSTCTIATSSGTASRQAASVVDAVEGEITVQTGSMFIIDAVDAPNSVLFSSTGGNTVDMSVGEDCVVTLTNLDIKQFCSDCDGTSGLVPTAPGDNAVLYAMNWTVDGSTTTAYVASGFSYAAGVVSGKDDAGNCRSLWCLPVNSGVPTELSSGQCQCNCNAGTYYPMCLDKPDPTLNYVGCSDPNCMTCSISQQVCDQCIDGYQINSVKGCSKILCDMPDCRACLAGNPKYCEVCATGYGPNGDGTCSPCTVQYCATCNTALGTCDSCYNAYTLTDNTCISNSDLCQVPNCETCSANDVLQCATCKSGYGLTSTGKCARCGDANCLNCPNDTTTCTTCSSGYTLTQYGTCSPGGACQVENCAYCSTTDTNWCATCINGYSLNTATGQCVTSGTCLVENCQACNANNPNSCATCNSGYAKNSDGSCQAVTTTCQVANCDTCIAGSPTVCATCNSGYVVSGTGQCTPSSGQCLVLYCQTCVTGNPRQCLVCKTGYGMTTARTCVHGRVNAAGQPPRSLLFMFAVLVISTLMIAL